MDQRCPEPSLDELLADGAIHLLMRSDGVSESDIRAVLGSAAAPESRRGS